MIYAVFFLGMVIMGGLVFFIMPKMMFVTKQSKYNFSDTVEKIEESIIEHKWGHRGTWFIHNELMQKQIEFKQLFFFFKNLHIVVVFFTAT